MLVLDPAHPHLPQDLHPRPTLLLPVPVQLLLRDQCSPIDPVEEPGPDRVSNQDLLVCGLLKDELERLRPLCYKNADVFLLCYSVVRPCSFRNLIDRWFPEVHRLCPGAPLVLVGTQLDQREDVQVLINLAQNQERPVSTEEGRQLAQELGAVGFSECSALTQKNLKDVFDAAILASIQQTDLCSVQQQRRTLRKTTPDKVKTLSETWWRKITCLLGEKSVSIR